MIYKDNSDKEGLVYIDLDMTSLMEWHTKISLVQGTGIQRFVYDIINEVTYKDKSDQWIGIYT